MSELEEMIRKIVREEVAKIFRGVAMTTTIQLPQGAEQTPEQPTTADDAPDMPALRARLAEGRKRK